MFENKWEICPWAYEFQKDKVHPDDVEAFRQIHSTFLVFQCIGTEKEYIKIIFQDDIYRVKAELFREVPEPRFQEGEEVFIKNDVAAKIFGNEWHMDRKEHYYFVTVNGKKKSRRYFESEIRKCTI